MAIKQAPEATAQTTLRLPEAMLMSLKLRAVEKRTTIRAILRELVSSYLDWPKSNGEK